MLDEAEASRAALCSVSTLRKAAYLNAASTRLHAAKAVHLKHPDLKVAPVAERGVVERQAAICFAETYVFVHPDGLALPKI